MFVCLFFQYKNQGGIKRKKEGGSKRAGGSSSPCAVGLQISLSQNTVDTTCLQERKRLEKLMENKIINCGFLHVVTMNLKINPTQEVSGLCVKVTWKTLQRTVIHDPSNFTYFLRIIPLATARDTGLHGPEIAPVSFSQKQQHVNVCQLTVIHIYFQAAVKIHLNIHIKYKSISFLSIEEYR